jgi:hypothetical protein
MVPMRAQYLGLRASHEPPSWGGDGSSPVRWFMAPGQLKKEQAALHGPNNITRPTSLRGGDSLSPFVSTPQPQPGTSRPRPTRALSGLAELDRGAIYVINRFVKRIALSSPSQVQSKIPTPNLS